MRNITKQDTLISQLFYLFLIVHLIGWTLVPALVRYNLPLDSIEGAIWGHQLEWGYDKNPFMNGWLTALATYLGGPSGWMIYLFSQISVATSLFVVWQLAKRMLSPVYALLSVMLLEGVQYYNFHAIDFNDNTLELGLWGLTIYCFYLALTEREKTKTILCWVLTGLFAGLSMMAKYYTLALLAGMALFLFLNKENRKTLLTLAPWLGLIVFILTMLPHIVWLFSHEFVTVHYVFARAASKPNHMNHLFFPAQFAWQQLEVFLPGIILLLLFMIGKRPILTTERTTLSTFNRGFLFYVGFAPFLLTLLLSMALGIKLRAGWGMPLLSLWGVILIAIIQPCITRARVIRFYSIVIILIVTLLTCYSYSLRYSPDTSSANFPGKEVAASITQKWHERYHTPLTYLAGSRWAGGNVAFYSADHPAVLIEWNPLFAPWINIEDMEKKGAIFIWDISDHETLPDDIKARFPRLGPTEIIEYQWKNNVYHLPPGKIGIAFLPPL